MLSNASRVRFNDDDSFAGEYGLIIGTLPRQRRNEDVSYRIKVESRLGIATATADRFEVVGGKASAPRPYGAA